MTSSRHTRRSFRDDTEICRLKGLIRVPLKTYKTKWECSRTSRSILSPRTESRIDSMLFRLRAAFQYGYLFPIETPEDHTADDISSSPINSSPRSRRSIQLEATSANADIIDLTESSPEAVGLMDPNTPSILRIRPPKLRRLNFHIFISTD